MPFTPAHVVAAVPLAPVLGRHASVSALAIGSITPDLGYFLPIDIARWHTHNLGSLLWFSLPVGLAAFALFHSLVAPLIHDLAPAPTRHRLPARWSTGTWPPVRIADVALCVVVGAITHLLWDEFTHTGTSLTRTFPDLGRTYAQLAGLRVTPVHVLQQASTLFGFVVLAHWGWRWLRVPARAESSSSAAPLARALLVLAIAGPGAFVVADALHTHWPAARGVLAQLRGLASVVVFIGGPVWFGSLVLVAAGWRAVGGARARAGAPACERSGDA